MKQGDTAFIIENNQIKKVEILKVTRDFITVKYNTYLPSEYGGYIESVGGIRLRRSKVFETKEKAKQHIV